MKTKVIPPVLSQRGQEKAYQKQLNKLGKALIVAVKKNVLEYLKAQEPGYVMDSLGSDLGDIFNKLNAMFTGTVISSFAQTTSQVMVSKVSKSNKAKFERSVGRATGVNLEGIIAEEGLADFVELSVSKNVSLIKSLPEEYLKQVETIVNNGVINGSKYSTIAKEINSKTGASSKLANRIKTIAMNEVQTINAQISQRRSEALGVTEGIYRTSEDEKVRPCHKELNGKRYVLSKGAWSGKCGKYIIPGITDINCRCSFSPVIEVS